MKMKCPYCQKDLSEDFKTVWKLGYLEGEMQLQRTINLIKATINNLTDELLRLDYEKPVVYDPRMVVIQIKLTRLRKFVKILYSKKTSFEQRSNIGTILQGFIKEHERHQREIVEKLEEGLKKRK
jgi:predicted double-glycine peptidase